LTLNCEPPSGDVRGNVVVKDVGLNGVRRGEEEEVDEEEYCCMPVLAAPIDDIADEELSPCGR